MYQGHTPHLGPSIPHDATLPCHFQYPMSMDIKCVFLQIIFIAFIALLVPPIIRSFILRTLEIEASSGSFFLTCLASLFYFFLISHIVYLFLRFKFKIIFIYLFIYSLRYSFDLVVGTFLLFFLHNIYIYIFC